MMELMSGGTTVLFVSHDLKQIEDMCDRVIWLEDHRLKMFDTADVVCKAYRDYWD